MEFSTSIGHEAPQVPQQRVEGGSKATATFTQIPDYSPALQIYETILTLSQAKPIGYDTYAEEAIRLLSPRSMEPNCSVDTNGAWQTKETMNLWLQMVLKYTIDVQRTHGLANVDARVSRRG